MKKSFIGLIVLSVVFLGFFVSIVHSANTLQMISKGKISALMIQNVGMKYGDPSDSLDAEVIIKLDADKDMSFGFQLRDDSNLPVRRGMLDLLRDAFKINVTIVIEYAIVSGKKTGVIWRIWLPK